MPKAKRLNLPKLTNKVQQQLDFENEEDNIINSLSTFGYHKQFSNKQVPNKHKYGTHNYGFFRNNIKTIKKRFDYNHNWYITLNTFHSYEAADKNVSCFIANFVDLDTIEAGIHHFNWRKLIRFLNDKYHVKVTTVIMSGHGYYLIFFYNHPIHMGMNTKPSVVQSTINKWENVEIDLKVVINDFSKKYYHTTIVDPRSTNPGRLLRQSNTENVKYQKANNRYVMPVDVQILMVNPKNRSSVKELTKHLVTKDTINKIKRYHYYLKHKKYYDAKTKRIDYIKGVKARIRSYKRFKKYQKLAKQKHKHISNNQFPKYHRKIKDRARLHLIYRKKIGNKRSLQGFYHHIQNPKYKLYGHVEEAMFLYTCLLLENYQLTVSEAMKSLNSFVHKVLQPKVKKEYYQFPNSDAKEMFNRIQKEVIHFRNNKYLTRIKGKVIHHHPNARFYEPKNTYIVDEMEFKGRLYHTKSDKRTIKRKYKELRNKAILVLRKNKHLSVNAISKKLHMSRNTINRILNKK